jgi:hypothetical protein
MEAGVMAKVDRIAADAWDYKVPGK